MIPATQVRDQLRAWYGSRWWAPNKLKRAALTDTLHGIYLPYWTFDAHVDADWTAESGYHYYVTETYRGRERQNRDPPGPENPLGRQRRAVCPISSMTTPCPAPSACTPPCCGRSSPSPPSRISNPTIPPTSAAGRSSAIRSISARPRRSASSRWTPRSSELCSREVPGDTQRNLQVGSTYQGRTFKHILVPVWLVTYTYGAKSFQVVVNGYTGKMAGEHPLSWVKITLAVLAVLIVILIIVALNQQQ